MASTSPMKLLLTVLFVILLHCYSCGSIIIEGTRDVELETQLKILNKTPIKTIRTKVGDVFDCIDINKQPSLDHHLLKNHVLKTRPIPHSINRMGNDNHEGVSSSSFSYSIKPSSRIAILKKLSCPDGTVPIRRVSKEDLRRAKLFSESQLVYSSNVGERDDLENPGQGQFLSIAKTRKDSGIDYSGISALINVYNPPVTEDQVSTAQIWIENGSKEGLNSLQAGWIVAPSLFGNNITRLFGKWQGDGSNKSKGCYNILCPGFVQVSETLPLGMSLSRTSRYGESSQVAYNFSISQDGGKNWWLEFDYQKVGYWPAELGFSQLARGSSLIAWGGYAAKSRATTVPPTGNGHFPYSPYVANGTQCFMMRMKVIPAKTLYWEDPTGKIIDTFATKKQCSNIIYFGNPLPDHELHEHMLTFGGPGGNC